MNINNKRLLYIVACIAVCLVLLGYYHDRRTCWGSNDFDTYYFAGELVVKGANLYTHEAFRTTLSPYLYLPFFAIFILPLTFLHIRIASMIWYMLNVGALIGTFYVSGKLIAGENSIKQVFFSRPHLLKIISGVFIIAIWADNMSLAQVDFMLLFLILLSLFAYDKKRPFLSGVVLAFATVIKLYPAYFLLYFIAKKRFKAVIGFVVGLALFVLLVPWMILGQDNFNNSMKSWKEMKADTYLQKCGRTARENYGRFDSQFKPSNQSFSSVITRYFMGDDKVVAKWKTEDHHYQIYWPHTLKPWQVDIAIKVLLLAMFLATYLIIDYKLVYTDRIYISLEYSVIFLSMILFFPVVQTHMFAAVAFPIITFNYIKIKTREKWVYNNRIIDYGVLLALAIYALQAFKYMKVLGAGCFNAVLLWLVFMGMLVKEKKKKQQKE